MLLSDSSKHSAGSRKPGQGRTCPDARGERVDFGPADEEPGAPGANTAGMRRVLLRPVLVLAAVGSLAACGSTVQMGPTAAGGAQVGQGLSAPTAAPGQPGAVGTAPGGALPGGAGGAGGTAPGSTGSGGTYPGSTTSGGGAGDFGVGGVVASTYQKYPHYFDISSVRLDRLGPMTSNGLYRAGYFSGKLGFVTWDDPNYRFAYTHGYVPALASHGISVTDK